MNKTIEKINSLAGQYTRFIISGEEYGIKSSQVKSVVKIPKIRKVPKAPYFIEGVSNIDGRIVPLINPVKRLDISQDNKLDDCKNKSFLSKNSLILVELDKSIFGILVDNITLNSNISSEIIEPVNPLINEKGFKFITGIAKLPDNIIYLIDLNSILTAGIQVEQSDKESYVEFSSYLNNLFKKKKIKKNKQFLKFQISDEIYAISSNKVKSVALFSDLISQTKGPDYLAGIIKHNNSMLPVIDLQIKFNLNIKPYTNKSRIMIIDSMEYGFGVIVNNIDDFISLSQNQIKKPPEGINDSSSNHINGIGMINGGKEMIVMIDEKNILNHEQINELLTMDNVNMKSIDKIKDTTTKSSFTDYLIVKVKDIELAIRTFDTLEVILSKDIKSVPKAPSYIKGVVSFKGEPLPVIDLYIRLDINKEKQVNKPKIVIVSKDNSHYGLLVDSAFEILTAAQEDIVKPPDILHNVNMKYISNIIMTKDTERSPMILNLDSLADKKI